MRCVLVMVEFHTTAEHNIQWATSDGRAIVYNLGDMAWVLTSTCLVFIMIPGVALLYSGLLRQRNAFTDIAMSVMVLAVASIEWFFWGYSLAFSPTSSQFIGNLYHFGLMHVDMQALPGVANIPVLLYALYQLMFAALTPVIACGAFAGRARVGPVLLFTFCWCTIVYNPIACWTWNSNGWSYMMGGLDYAGGTPVHISSGTAALVISLYLGYKYGSRSMELPARPHNTTCIILGTVFIWFGWFGFNGGSGAGANLRSAQAMMVTHIAACAGGITLLVLDYRFDRKWSVISFCSGAMAGLVAITPASGYVGTPSALVFGVVGSVASHLATPMKDVLGYDIFVVHGLGGMVGNVLTALFADGRIATFDRTSPTESTGWINHHWVQLGYQLADSCAGFAWTFVMTLILMMVIDHVPYCAFQCDEDISMVSDLPQSLEHGLSSSQDMDKAPAAVMPLERGVADLETGAGPSGMETMDDRESITEKGVVTNTTLSS